ncbi:MAG: hypothetical protein M1828_007310 [Chrysothrix sp. TS-e1954]|nr:MAG: hypothetical protein M1828_007310 [Chrysothrix sp. TS-e1954]
MGAGGLIKTRHLSRTSPHRRALLRNLVTSLFTHESITTTWPKAKEAQMLAEKLITLGKRNTEASKRRALSIFFTPHALLPRLFGPLRERYASRPGGYTRVLRVEPRANDQAPTALLELVDGDRDMRFAITAQTVARQRVLGLKRATSQTEMNVKKVTRFRPDGARQLEQAVGLFTEMHERGVGVVDPSELEAGGSGAFGASNESNESNEFGQVSGRNPYEHPLNPKTERYAHTRRPHQLFKFFREKRSDRKYNRNDGDKYMRREGGPRDAPF